MKRVAIVTDSASDLTDDVAASAGITVVPLIVTFGSESFKAGVEMSVDEFWRRMRTPDSPLPSTAAASPGDFQQVYQRAFDEGADAIVSVHVAGTLSATIKSAEIAREMLGDREIHIVDSMTASMGVGLLAQMGADLAALGVTASEIARILTQRAADLDLYVAVDTLDYLKRGGRISGPRAAIGTLLSVKPIITIRDGEVDASERVRTRAKARERVLALLTSRPLERIAILHTTDADVEDFAARAAVASGLGPAAIQVMTVGPAVGAHLGPGCIGGVVLYAR